MPSNNDMQQAEILYTLASTFEKKNSLSFNLLFGCPKITRPVLNSESSLPNVTEHLFLPGQIFGLEYRSTGRDFQKFHHILVLRSCTENILGTMIPGVSPGAEVLVQASTNTVLLNLISVFKKIQSFGICLTKIDSKKYEYLNQLLSMKMRTDFFTGELIEQAKNL
ncbi:MAG: hypothetical protein BWZ03_00295 [bacterium ADurb.BinA186]|nr:MAG: hypothetical protein BWZ03_00295 [bacterium ADurb.BinA186]